MCVRAHVCVSEWERELRELGTAQNQFSTCSNEIFWNTNKVFKKFGIPKAKKAIYLSRQTQQPYLAPSVHPSYFLMNSEIFT